MNLAEASFKITEDNNCPLYTLEDEFKLSGDLLLLPHDRVACLILAEDIKNAVNNENFETSYNSFYCSGCTGFVKLESGQEPEAKKNNSESAINEDDIDTIASLLSDFSFFQTLNENDIKKLVSYLKLKKFEKNDTIIKKESLEQTYTLLYSEGLRSWVMITSASHFWEKGRFSER